MILHYLSRITDHRPLTTDHCYNARSGGILAKRGAPTVRQGSSGTRARTRAAGASASERGRRPRASRVSASSMGQAISSFVSTRRIALSALAVVFVAALSLAALFESLGARQAMALEEGLRGFSGGTHFLVKLLIAVAA